MKKVDWEVLPIPAFLSGIKKYDVWQQTKTLFETDENTVWNFDMRLACVNYVGTPQTLEKITKIA